MQLDNTLHTYNMPLGQTISSTSNRSYNGLYIYIVVVVIVVVIVVVSSPTAVTV